jgi:hypothetical protein
MGLDQVYTAGVNLPGCSFGFSVATRWGGFSSLPDFGRVPRGNFLRIRVFPFVLGCPVVENEIADRTERPSSGVDLDLMAMMRSPEVSHSYRVSVEL